MQNLINIDTTTPEVTEALKLHQQIIVNANMAYASWVETCKALKKMRDTKLYTHLGFESFEDYTVKELGIKERQAYTYISTLEKLGEPFLQSNAEIGITKLSLLVSVPAPDRQELADNNDLAGMSVEEVKKLVAENNAKGEQIAMLLSEVEDLKTDAENQKEELDVTDRHNTELEERVCQLEEELEKERNKPTEVAVSEPTPEMIAKIKADAEKTAKKDFAAETKALKSKHAAELDSVKKKAKEDTDKAISEYKQKLEEVNSESAAAIKRAAELEKELMIAANPETIKFSAYFESFQADYKKLYECITALEGKNKESSDKFKGALRQYLDIVRQELEE